MFEGSECVEVEGGSTESTVASSISACKKVRKKRSCLSCVCVGMEVCIYLCVPASIAACQPRPLFAFFSARAHVHLSIISVSPVICWCVFPAVQEISISSSGVPVPPRGCVIRGTARLSGQPSRFIISQCHRDRRENSPDQWAEVEAREFSFKVWSVCVCSLTSLCTCRWTRWCVFLISLALVISTDFHSECPVETQGDVFLIIKPCAPLTCGSSLWCDRPR